MLTRDMNYIGSSVCYIVYEGTLGIRLLLTVLVK